MADDVVTLGGPERGPERGAGRGSGAGHERGVGPGIGADEAIESLFHSCYPRLVRTAFALVDDWDLAEQLAQEAYLRLWRRWRWIADPAAAPSYLQRTVVNLARETIRRRVVERRALRRRGLDRPDEPPPDPGDVAELRRAIAGLPARKRECVVLRYLVGLSEAETADMLKISVGTVKSQTHKGVRLLRERLDAADAADAADAHAADVAGAAARPAEPGREERTSR